MSSVFTSRITKDIDITHDAPNKAVIRKLAPRHLEAAAKESQRESLEYMRQMGPAFLREVQALTADDEKAKKAGETGAIAAAKARDPLLTFDKATLVAKGLVSWTYDAKVDAASIEDLDEETLDLLAREILRLTKPALFAESPIESEDAQVKG